MINIVCEFARLLITMVQNDDDNSLPMKSVSDITIRYSRRHTPSSEVVYGLEPILHVRMT